MKLADLNELEFDNLANWPFPAKIGGVALVCAFLVAMGYYFDTQVQMQDLEKARAQETELRQLFEFKQRKAINLDVYRGQMREIEKTFGSLLRQLPSRTEVAELLSEVNQAGLEAGLEFELFKPQPEVPAEFYAELPVKLRVKGKYHQFGTFVSNVASLPRIVTLHDFQIVPSQKTDGGVLVMEATAKTYRYLDENEMKKLSGK